ncbi:MAG: response regulator [Solirubrobacteraceae bacterium]
MARVFLCEDDASFRLLTRIHLEAAGHEIVGESADGTGCDAAIPAVAPDVALIDNLLTREQWATIRKGTPDTKLVLFSGMPDSRLAQEAERVGADASIPKRVATSELCDTVARLAASS